MEPCDKGDLFRATTGTLPSKNKGCLYKKQRHRKSDKFLFAVIGEHVITPLN
jgi:hypothetical protein